MGRNEIGTRLSIITVNLNDRVGLEKTMKSVLDQSFPDFEYIIVDGGSTDGSVEVIEEHKDRLAYWTSEPDTGIYNAMNKGIKHAKGEYCLFLNSGDWLYDNKVLERAFDLRFDEDLVYGVQMLEASNGIEEIISIDPEYITFRSFMKTSIPHQSTFIRTDLFKRAGVYNEGNAIVSDWEFTLLAIFKLNCSIRKIPSRIAVYNLRGVSNKHEFMNQQKHEKRMVLERHFRRFVTDYDDFERVSGKIYFRLYYTLRNLKNAAVRAFRIWFS